METNKADNMAKSRLERLLAVIRRLEIEFPVAEIAKKTNYGQPTVSQYLTGKQKVSSKFLKSFCEAYNLDYDKEFPKNQEITETGSKIRDKKAFGPTEDEGLIFVPIAAQAGYARHFDEPVYLNQLSRTKIQGLQYRGDNYRIFEVEGDSMCWYDEKSMKIEGLQQGYQVIAQKVEKEDWQHITQYYVYVIVFEDIIHVKRLYRDPEKGNKELVMISDNPMYEQKRVKIEDVREIWLMKRYISWNVPPPKKYEITV